MSYAESLKIDSNVQFDDNHSFCLQVETTKCKAAYLIMTDSQPEFDPFVANRVYPDAAGVFSREIRSLAEVKDDAIVVLDTNVLLVPYTVGKEGLTKIGETYSTLAAANRLCIPGQVAREFANNRAKKLTELAQQFNRKMSSAAPTQKGTYPLLEDFPDYLKIVELESAIDAQLKKYRDAIKGLLNSIQSWSWNDPVSSLYSEVFKGDVVVDLPIASEDELIKELRRRKIHSLPPGYKDSGKDDEGIGDFLVWLTILKVAKEKKKSTIFVSGDEKADWWLRSDGKGLYPRYELVDEYHRESEGHAFHMISFSQYLDLFGVSESVVEEVGVQEAKQSATNDASRIDADATHGADLSTEAISILTEAAAGDGRIMHLRYIGGENLQANGKSLFPSSDRRTIAKWLGGLEDLQRYRLVAALGHKNEIFEVTREGYEVADALNQQ